MNRRELLKMFAAIPAIAVVGIPTGTYRAILQAKIGGQWVHAAGVLATFTDVTYRSVRIDEHGHTTTIGDPFTAGLFPGDSITAQAKLKYSNGVKEKLRLLETLYELDPEGRLQETGRIDKVIAA